MKGDKTQLRTPQIRPYPLQEKFKILFLGGYVYDVTNSSPLCVVVNDLKTFNFQERFGDAQRNISSETGMTNQNKTFTTSSQL